MLPNGYTSITCLWNYGNNSYIDTGVKPSSDLSIELLFSAAKGTSAQGATAIGYIFGARDSNSNSSTGQMNFYLGLAGASDYVGWRSARIGKTLESGDLQASGSLVFHLSSTLNEFTLCASNILVTSFTGVTTSFEGNRNIYLFGLNNGGNYLRPGVSFKIWGCKIYSNSVLIREFVPAYDEANQVAGMYDLVNDSFYGSGTSEAFYSPFLIATDQSVGGVAYIRTRTVGDVSKQYTYSGSSYGADPSITVVAKPHKGYVFTCWEIDGERVSNDIEYTFTPTSATTIKAVFQRAITLDTKNFFKGFVINYGAYTKKQISFVQVLSASIKEDLMQETATSFKCMNIPSAVQQFCPFVLYDPKGKIIFYGMIDSIEGDTIICKPPISIFNDDYLMLTSDYNAIATVAYQIERILNKTGDSFIENKKRAYKLNMVSREMFLDADYVCNEHALQIPSNEIINGKDYAIEQFSKFGIGFRYGLQQQYDNNYQLTITPFVPQGFYEKLVISDGMENIQNVVITTEEADCNIVDIYNASGTSLVGTYGITEDNKIVKWNNNDSLYTLIAWYKCKRKIVTSDDDPKTLAKENLNTSYYSHQITFDLIFNDLLRFDDIHLGQNVDFYSGDKLYRSILTAVEYEISEIDDFVNSAKCTLGIVRTSLTAKLNIGGLRR